MLTVANKFLSIHIQKQDPVNNPWREVDVMLSLLTGSVPPQLLKAALLKALQEGTFHLPAVPRSSSGWECGCRRCSQLSEGTNCSDFTPKEQVGQKYQAAVGQTNCFKCLHGSFCSSILSYHPCPERGSCCSTAAALTALMSLLYLMSRLSSSEVFHTTHVPCVV